MRYSEDIYLDDFIENDYIDSVITNNNMSAILKSITVTQRTSCRFDCPSQDNTKVVYEEYIKQVSLKYEGDCKHCTNYLYKEK